MSNKKLYVILDGLFTKTDGRASSNHLGYEHFAKRYLSVFDQVTIVTRVGTKVDSAAKYIDGPQVDVMELPDIRRMFPFLMYIPKLLWVLFHLPRNASYILRIPGFITTIASFVFFVRRVPYGVEVVADPADALDAKSFNHPLQCLLKPFQTFSTRFQCSSAKATAYVTQHALQKRYPPNPSMPTYNYTSLDLHADMFSKQPRDIKDFNLSKPTVINVAMMQKTIKAQDVLLNAFKLVRDNGVDARLVLIGGGDHQVVFEEMAKDLELEEFVKFTGLLPKGDRLLSELDNADLFVLPSRQEGLPRAMIEAMARALPCISSDVGGADELLSREYLVEVNDVEMLAKKIVSLLNNPNELVKQSNINRTKAESLEVSQVQPRREQFYKTVLGFNSSSEKSS